MGGSKIRLGIFFASEVFRYNRHNKHENEKNGHFWSSRHSELVQNYEYLTRITLICNFLVQNRLNSILAECTEGSSPASRPLERGEAALKNSDIALSQLKNDGCDLVWNSNMKTTYELMLIYNFWLILIFEVFFY